jgi:hypothetical protein
MKYAAITFSLPLLFTVTLAACDREGPPKPVGSATNKHVEQSPASSPNAAADAITGAMKSPVEHARQTEGVLQGAADSTSRQAEQASR